MVFTPDTPLATKFSTFKGVISFSWICFRQIKLKEVKAALASPHSSQTTFFFFSFEKWEYDSGAASRNELGAISSTSITRTVKFVPKLCIPSFSDIEVILGDDITVPSSKADALWRGSNRNENLLRLRFHAK